MNLLDKYKELNSKDEVKMSYNEDKGLYTFTYIHGGQDFTNPLLRLARGLTLDSKGNIIVRGFEKFFNYLQLEDRDNSFMSDNFKEEFNRLTLTSEDELLECYEKLDGTCIMLSVYEDEFVVATTSSTQSFYSQNAVNYFKGVDKDNRLFYFIKENNKTLVFEFISPSNQVVVRYDKDDYVLLGIVDNATGLEYSTQQVIDFSKEYGLSVFNIYSLTLGQLMEKQSSDEQLEGFVIKNIYGRRLKFKLDSWFEFSKTYNLFYGSNITERKVREVLNLYIEDKIDDIIAFQNQHEVHKKNPIVSNILNCLDEYIHQAEKIYNNYQLGKLDKKEISKINSWIKYLVFNKIERGDFINPHRHKMIINQVLSDLNVSEDIV